MKTENRTDGFTLLELLVVIVILLVLAAMMMPHLMDALLQGRLTETANNGKVIGTSLLIAELNGNITMPSTTATEPFLTSTDFFKWAITNGIVDSTFRVCWAKGMDLYNGVDPVKFTEKNNAWCVVADISESDSSMMPVMFTRNLNIASLADPLEGALTDAPPFGKHGVVVVRKDLSVTIIAAADLAEAFNPLGIDRPVLRP
jgi:prepilin-type N-terminal cleavage/methylation domain-containing protein